MGLAQRTLCSLFISFTKCRHVNISFICCGFELRYDDTGPWNYSCVSSESLFLFLYKMQLDNLAIRYPLLRSPVQYTLSNMKGVKSDKNYNK